MFYLENSQNQAWIPCFPHISLCNLLWDRWEVPTWGSVPGGVALQCQVFTNVHSSVLRSGWQEFSSLAEFWESKLLTLPWDKLAELKFQLATVTMCFSTTFLVKICFIDIFLCFLTDIFLYTIYISPCSSLAGSFIIWCYLILCYAELYLGLFSSTL